jgi:hypothetical protein
MESPPEPTWRQARTWSELLGNLRGNAIVATYTVPANAVDNQPLGITPN